MADVASSEHFCRSPFSLERDRTRLGVEKKSGRSHEAPPAKLVKTLHFPFICPSLGLAGRRAFLAWARLVRLVMTDGAACGRAHAAVSTRHVSSDAANDCALDAAFGFDLIRRNGGDENERGEKSSFDFHVNTPDTG
jgi:hypothetical protein